LNKWKREEQVEGLLTYQFETLIVPKELGNSKGIMENPILKIELTKTNAFKVATFGEYLDVKRKGRTPIAAKSKKEVPKKKRVKTIELDDADKEKEESEESTANDDKEEYEEDEEKDGKKRKLEKTTKMPSASFATKDYVSEISFKTSPNKTGKPHSKLSPFKPVPEVTKKDTVRKKIGKCRKDRNFGQDDDRYGGENYKSGVRQHKGLTGSNS
jgi:hypothetical protein